MGWSAGADNEDEWFEIENKRNRNDSVAVLHTMPYIRRTNYISTRLQDDANCKDVMKPHPVDFEYLLKKV